MSTPPPPQLLNKEFLRRCRDIVLNDGWINEISKEMNLPYNTVHGWYIRDSQNFNEKMNKWRRRRMVEKANEILNETLSLDVNTPVLFFGKEIGRQINPKMVKIKVDNAQFVAETLARDQFSKRSEMTGKDGGAVTVNVVNFADTAPEKEDDQVKDEDDDL